MKWPGLRFYITEIEALGVTSDFRDRRNASCRLDRIYASNYKNPLGSFVAVLWPSMAILEGCSLAWEPPPPYLGPPLVATKSDWWQRCLALCTIQSFQCVSPVSRASRG